MEIVESSSSVVEFHGVQATRIIPDGAELVSRIRAGDRSGVEELYRIFACGIKRQICRQLGPQDLDDKVHHCFLIVIDAIRRGDVREPERLPGFIRTVVQRQVARSIETVVKNRRRMVDFDDVATLEARGPNPETAYIDCEEEELAYRVLQSLSSRDREILIRFYLREESPEAICEKMNLTGTQFRLLKSRAKARFVDMGRAAATSQRLVS